MARRNISSARAIVTGASSGIGRAIAMELSRQGAQVVVTARREDRLRQLVAQIRAQGREARCVAGDITDPDVRRRCIDAASASFGGLDVLVNNAGIGALGLFADADEQRLRRIMEVNFFAPVELIRVALPLLGQGNRPIVVNIGSVLGHRAAARTSEYCASKFALHGMSDALRAELAGNGIDVLLVSPSTTESEFFDSVIERKGKPASVGDRKMPADVVARRTVQAIRRGKHEIILGLGGGTLVWLDRIFPSLANWLVARFG